MKGWIAVDRSDKKTWHGIFSCIEEAKGWVESQFYMGRVELHENLAEEGFEFYEGEFTLPEDK